MLTFTRRALLTEVDTKVLPLVIVLMLCLCLCGATLAVPPQKAHTPISPAEYGADHAYAVQFMGHVRSMVGILKKVGFQFQSTQPHDDLWKRKMAITLTQMRREAQAGRNLAAPPLFLPVQRLYSSAMAQYEDAARGLPAAIDTGNQKSGGHYAAEVKQATATMQRAGTLFGAIARQNAQH